MHSHLLLCNSSYKHGQSAQIPDDDAIRLKFKPPFMETTAQKQDLFSVITGVARGSYTGISILFRASTKF
jgi:hypothetical protein